MSREVKMITEEYIKDNSIINNNVDDKILGPFIILAQDKYLEPILGTRLFRKIENEVSGKTLSGIYKTIVDDYIARCLKEYVIYESYPHLLFKITNKSVNTKSGDNSDPAELNELRYLRDGVKDSAEYYAERLRKYLDENQSSISEYPDQLSGLDQIGPKNQIIYGGLFLGGSHYTVQNDDGCCE